MKQHKHRCHEVPHQPIPDEPQVGAISHDAIARRAHERFIERGCICGQDLDDWLAAEQELLQASGENDRVEH